ncbi:MAG TPA: ribonuclease H-like domain-containing protein [Terriglobia bacterium]|nr:ribonuclease H-like domain-containing protein [Terriglobia bacterium]
MLATKHETECRHKGGSPEFYSSHQQCCAWAASCDGYTRALNRLILFDVWRLQAGGTIQQSASTCISLIANNLLEDVPITPTGALSTLALQPVNDYNWRRERGKEVALEILQRLVPMDLEEKLRQLKHASQKSASEMELERQLEYLRRFDRIPKHIPARRASKGIEECVEGRIMQCGGAEFFLAEQALPFGRPYGKMRIGDVAGTLLNPLDLFLKGASLPDPSRLIFLDTETTGLAGGTGSCAFLIGIGTCESTGFKLRQLFLRDYTDERGALTALAEALKACEGLVTFNGKAFDVPLLETRYTLSRLQSPFRRLLHLDLLHPARRLWKLRLESCQLTHLEKEILGISREGDVPGSEIPGIYFDYLRSGDARGLQPVFFHNALDVISLAALAVEMANLVREAGCDGPLLNSCHGLDLFNLSRVLARTGVTARSISIGRRAVAAGLPEDVEPRALWHLGAQHKSQGEFAAAIELWHELTRRDARYALAAYRELAMHYERQIGDAETALAFTESALEILKDQAYSVDSANLIFPHVESFTRRRARLQKRLSCYPLARHRSTEG